MGRLVGIPLFGDRVAPRCNCAENYLLAQIENRAIATKETIHLRCQDEWDLVDELIGLGIEIFVCGGIEREYQRRFEAKGVRVIGNVAGEANEALAALAENRLESWFGYKSIETSSPNVEPASRPIEIISAPPADQNPPAPCLVNCLQCDERTCQMGQGCVAVSDSVFSGQGGAVSGSSYSFYLTSLAGAPISRMEDLGAYCKMLQCKRLGVVFCAAVFAEAEWIFKRLEEDIRILPLCCQFGCRREENRQTADRPLCDPGSLVSILNDAGCDLVVSLGPCAEFNAALDQASRAPVVSAIGKDIRAGGNLFPAAARCEERSDWRKKYCLTLNDE
ncbi:MAG: DUF1847 domain-containing protein [Candidatus Omnitrophota bacterium]